MIPTIHRDEVYAGGFAFFNPSTNKARTSRREGLCTLGEWWWS